MAGLVVLVMAMVCTSSYGVILGYSLVYNLSASVKGADDNTDLKATIPLKGYLVLYLSSPTSVEDADLILYGKDANTPTKQKVYVDIGYDSMTDEHYVDIQQIGDYVFLDIYEYSGVFYFEMFVMGKWKEKSIGPLVDSEDVAGSMKGSMIVWGGLLLGPPGQDVSGTANVSLTLNNSVTKWANGNNVDEEIKTQDDIVAERIASLENKDYSALPLP
jgi:hypothetical protein